MNEQKPLLTSGEIRAIKAIAYAAPILTACGTIGHMFGQRYDLAACAGALTACATISAKHLERRISSDK